MISPSLVLVCAMKRMGIKLRVFVCARDESDVRLLKLLLEEPVVSLDTYLLGSVKLLKTLFQEMAAPDALNLILIPLGTRQEDGFMQVRPEIMEIARSFTCKIVAMLNAASSAIDAANDAIAALSAFDEAEGSCVQGVIFLSPKNPGEYQLLEQDFGRRTHIMSLGYIPKATERARPSLPDLFGSAAGAYVMQVKSSVLQLVSNQYLIEWKIIEAFARLMEEWVPPQESYYLPKKIKVVLVGESTFSLESANARTLFNFLGCETVDYNPWKDPFPLEAPVYYFPHCLAEVCADKLLSHEPFLQGIRQAFVGNKLIFANGASAPLFGHHFISADGQQHEALNFFPFHGSYSSPTNSRNFSKVEIRALFESFFGSSDEKMRGCSLDYVRISNPGNVVPPMWVYRDSLKDTELGSSGWQKSYCFVTDLYLELWSCLDIVNRWLALRKK
ncbi:MAG: hypothetical protein LBO82_10550 [Synergistaceae bacterium]|nr:hypothetical protein [Synergistaceae bacterium]